MRAHLWAAGGRLESAPTGGHLATGPLPPDLNPQVTREKNFRLGRCESEDRLKLAFKACIVCGRKVRTPANRCDAHPKPRRKTTTQQGVGWDHQKRRAALLPLAIGAKCPLCEKPMLASEALDLDHSVPRAHDPNSKGDRITHAACNRRAGATVRRP